MKLNSSFKRCHSAGAICIFAVCFTVAFSGCKDKQQGDGAPPPAKVVQIPDMNLITIDSNDANRFPLPRPRRSSWPAN